MPASTRPSPPGKPTLSWRIGLPLVRRVLIVALMVVILIRPTWGHITLPAEQADLDLVFAVDRTHSMVAEDGPDGQTRLEQARSDLRVLAEELPGARLSVVTFGGEVVRTVLPFTTDTTAFTSLLPNITAEGAFDGVGSKLDAPLEELEQVLADDAEQHPDRRRLVVVLTDGENTASGEQDSYAPLAEYASGGAVLGYGTESGGTMLVDPEDPDRGRITDETGSDAVSKKDPDNLATVADQLGVEVLHRDTADTEPLRQLVADFEAQKVDGDGNRQQGREITWIFGLLILPLLLWELWAVRRRVREVRRFTE